MHDKESIYFKFQGPRRIKENSRVEYNNTLYNFDRLLRTPKRKYERGQLLEIEQLNTKNPSEFWKKINKLGPSRPKEKIKMECYLNDNNISSDPEQVMNKWERDYESLFNVKGDEFDGLFYNC